MLKKEEAPVFYEKRRSVTNSLKGEDNHWQKSRLMMMKVLNEEDVDDRENLDEAYSEELSGTRHTLSVAQCRHTKDMTMTTNRNFFLESRF